MPSTVIYTVNVEFGDCDPAGIGFVKSATYGDLLAIHVGVREWRSRRFVQTYEVRRGDDLILASEEVRIFATQREDGAGIQAMPIPPEIRALCER